MAAATKSPGKTQVQEGQGSSALGTRRVALRDPGLICQVRGNRSPLAGPHGHRGSWVPAAWLSPRPSLQSTGGQPWGRLRISEACVCFESL